ncbi:MAG TPA: PAS domain S-box protein, partial [Chryseolinea sp.]|nr:PAS domain S-box protein [Chryseolinea sp.]
MEDFYTSLALVSAGVSFAMSSVHLFLAFQRRDKSYLIFGLMGLALVFFFLLPPVGFILHDSPPYPANILFKRIFIFSYYILTPWFILAYSDYPKKILAYVNLFITIVCYLVMALTKDHTSKPIWSIIAVAGFGCILLLGILAVQWQVKQGQRSSSHWLAIAMAIYGCLFLLTAANQLTNGGLSRFFNMTLFFPMHLHSLFFMVIMGQRLVTSLLDKFRLEASVQEKEARWQSFMTNAPFIIIELDRHGRILFANSYGINLLGYQDLNELRFADWFDKFTSPVDREYFRVLYNEVISKQHSIDASKVPIRNKNNVEFIISWSNFPLTNEMGEIESVIRIGKDITESENASRLIDKLKDELVMEQINITTTGETTETNQTIIGSSKALRYAIQKAQQVATTHAPVFLEGETGVGKELFANLIHENST